MDLNVILGSIPENYHQHVADILVYFANKVFYSAHSGKSWVYVIPLIHILSKNVQSYEDPHLTSETIVWIDERFSVDKINPSSLSSIAK